MLKQFAAGIAIGLLALVQVSLSASLKIVCALGPNTSSYKQSEDQRPSGDAMQLAGKMNAAVKSICQSNCPAVMVLRNPTAANAMFAAEGNQPKLIYAPQFFAIVHEGFGDAGIIAIIAHEFGHALDDALGAAWIQPNWTPELRADSWAGCALAKSDLNPADLGSALNALAKYPSPAHPAWAVRLPVIRTGFTQCGGAPKNFSSATSPAKR